MKPIVEKNIHQPTRDGYVKKNSHTQKQAAELMATKQLICERAGISEAERCAVLFETGCRFVEYLVQNTKDCHRILTNPQRNFWAWWKVEFAKDDRDLVNMGADFDDYDYLKTKLVMLELEIRRTAFLHLVYN
jgi:hypothetical protein